MRGNWKEIEVGPGSRGGRGVRVYRGKTPELPSNFQGRWNFTCKIGMWVGL